jgi:ketol-acid reductoisomerase
MLKGIRNRRISAKALQQSRIAVLGYGSQGRAQALNLRDSGLRPVIGLPAGSKLRIRAQADGFNVLSPIKAIANADIIAILIPDHLHRDLVESIPAKALGGKSLIFAHGLSVAFGFIKPPSTCDIILVAPHGPGIRIRELYLGSKPFTAFWAIEHDASGNAAKIGKAYAAAIGCPQKNLFRTSFREEAIGDIFGEQAVLCGGLVGLLESGFETLVQHGLSAENAYLECVYQLDLIVDLIKRHGPAGMFDRISKTAAIGSLKAKDRLFGSEMEKRMTRLYDEIADGRFAKTLMHESDKGLKDYKRKLAVIKKSRLQKTHERLKKKLSAESNIP